MSTDPAVAEDLPVVQVMKTGDAEVLVKWGEGGAQQTSGMLGDNYSIDPYYFRAEDSSGAVPIVKAFGTLVACDGGILTIGDTRYRIKSSRQQKNGEKSSINNNLVVEQLGYVCARMKKDEEDEATLLLSKPLLQGYTRAVTKIGVVIDAPQWEKKQVLEGQFSKLGSRMGPFVWLEGNEDSKPNRTKYMAYLRNNQNIGTPLNGKLFDGTQAGDLLSAEFASFGVKTKGNIDVVVAHERHQETHTTRNHMWAGIELKKEENKNHVEIRRQVILQHLSASFLNENTGILTLMTDLCDRWHFYWFSKEHKRLMAFIAGSKGEANYLIRHMMDDSGTPAPTDFLNRASWNQMFPPPTEGDAIMNKSREGDLGRHNDGGDHDSSETSDSSRKRGPSGHDGRQQNRPCTGGANSGIDGDANAMMNSLDFMDEEEEREARFRDVLNCILPQLGLFPPHGRDQDHPTEGPPNHIGVM